MPAKPCIPEFGRFCTRHKCQCAAPRFVALEAITAHPSIPVLIPELSHIPTFATILGMKARSVFFAIAVAPAWASAAMFLVNSPATYLRANGEVPYNAGAIDIIAAGYSPGQTVYLSRVGQWDEGGPLMYGLCAVFSSSNALLPSPLLNRVPGAISAGPTWTSPNTMIGNLPTDIAEDFMVCNNSGTANGIMVTIPAGANYIFCTVPDSFFFGNNNAPELYLKISAVPEPATYLVFAAGIAMLAVARRNRAA